MGRSGCRLAVVLLGPLCALHLPAQEERAPEARIQALQADMRVLDRQGRELQERQRRLAAATGAEKERLEQGAQALSEDYRRLFSSTREAVLLARKEYPGDPRVRRLNLQFALAERNLPQALEDLQAITAAEPADEAMGLAQARLLMDLGKPEEVPAAIRALRKAAGRSTLGAEILLEALGALCRWTESLEEIAALEGRPEAPEHLAGLKAERLFQLGEYAEAERVARAALAQARRSLDGPADPARAERVQDLMGRLAELAQAAQLYTGYLEEERRALAAEEAAGDCPRVRLHTAAGPILIELFEESAPNTVANFLTLAGKGFYDGTRFHRVVPGFMAQGGDPNSRDADPSNDGLGGPGYFLADECRDPGARRHFAGRISMANSGPDTGGSQFFLTHSTTWHLNGRHTVFGRVLEGMPALLALRKGDALERVEIVRKRDHSYPVIRIGR